VPATDEYALFEALNAKKLEPAEIAASFVIPAQYDQLVGPDHTVLVGPRGSGKTTLLRMLQGETLMSWDHRRAADYRRRVRYSAIFLPADRIWASQTASPGLGAELAIAAFTTQMLYALTEAMIYRAGASPGGRDKVHHGVSMRHRVEVDLVTDCAEAWKLAVRSPSLVGLQTALDLRLAEIGEELEAHARDVSQRATEEPARPWERLVPLQALNFGIRAFNRHAGQPSHRWALLLDEMELAPERVHRALYGQLRGGEKLLILKLSFSPVDRNFSFADQPGGPSAEHDYRPIYLWYGTRVGARRFTRGLWTRMMRELRGESSSPAAVLGESEFDTATKNWSSGGSAYRRGSPQQRLIERMYVADSSFRKYLDSRNMAPDRLEDVDYRRRSATLRKVFPLLVFRQAVLDFDKHGRPVHRVRKKTLEPFTGSEAVFAALEGNPRWIKAVFSRMLAAYDGSRVAPGFQYDVLRETAERFESLLMVLPPEGNGATGAGTVLDLLEGIVEYFHSRTFGPFTADPPSTFIVDDLSPQVEALLRTALSAGAVVHLRSNSSPSILRDLKGERFRIAYLLTLRDGHELPLRLGKAVGLSRILRWVDQERSRRRAEDPDGRGAQESIALTLWGSTR
jgi:hypothetical protein